jgi:hypothetical protein
MWFPNLCQATLQLQLSAPPTSPTAATVSRHPIQWQCCPHRPLLFHHQTMESSHLLQYSQSITVRPSWQKPQPPANKRQLRQEIEQSSSNETSMIKTASTQIVMEMIKHESLVYRKSALLHITQSLQCSKVNIHAIVYQGQNRVNQIIHHPVHVLISVLIQSQNEASPCVQKDQEKRPVGAPAGAETFRSSFCDTER